MARGGRRHQRQAMRFALEHRQAVVVRTNAANEQRVAVIQQVVCRDGRADRPLRVAHVFGGVLGGDVLEHDLERRKIAAQRLHHGVDEDGFAIEDVDRGVGHFAVHQQGHADVLHRFERLGAAAQVGHAGIAVGGGAGRVELDAMHEAAGAGGADFLGRGVVGQVQRHQRLEARARRQRGEDALAVGASLRGGRHRRLEVGHDDRPAELARGVAHHVGERVAIAQVQVPVIRADDGQGIDHDA